MATDPQKELGKVSFAEDKRQFPFHSKHFHLGEELSGAVMCCGREDYLVVL